MDRPTLDNSKPGLFRSPELNVPRRKVLAVTITAIAAERSLGQLPPDTSGSKTPPLHYLNLLELADKLRKRELSPVAALDPKLMAFDTITADLALAQAKIAETEIRAGRYLGPLHGIPFAVKDLFFTDGIPTRGGLKVYANHFPKFNATAVSGL